MKLICPPAATPEEVGATLILCHICHPGADALQNQRTLTCHWMISLMQHIPSLVIYLLGLSTLVIVSKNLKLDFSNHLEIF